MSLQLTEIDIFLLLLFLIADMKTTRPAFGFFYLKCLLIYVFNEIEAEAVRAFSLRLASGWLVSGSVLWLKTLLLIF